METMTEVSTIGFSTVSLGFGVQNNFYIEETVVGYGLSIGLAFMYNQYWIHIKKNGNNSYIGKNNERGYFDTMGKFGMGWNTKLEALNSNAWYIWYNSNPQLMGS
jgi:hypothetical protein